ncbi:unnamed protein product [Closterium sp. NIES-53]
MLQQCNHPNVAPPTSHAPHPPSILIPLSPPLAPPFQEEGFEEIRGEIEMLQQCNHPNVAPPTSHAPHPPSILIPLSPPLAPPFQEEGFEEIRGEIEMLQQCNHPNVVRYHGSYQGDDFLWVNTRETTVGEWIDCGCDGAPQ